MEDGEHGTTFEPIFDHERVIAIGDIAVAPSEPNIVWVDTGEPNNSTTDPYASYWGDGAYKSTDGGTDVDEYRSLPTPTRSDGLWSIRPTPRSCTWPRSATCTPTIPKRHLPNRRRRESWEQVLALVVGGRHVSFVDVVIDPREPKTLYAAVYDRTSKPWMFFEGGPASGIYKTTDGGDSWRKLEAGLPTGSLGRIGLAIYPKDPAILYASILVEVPDDERYRNRVYRTENGGEAWRRVSALDEPLTGGSYFGQIRVDPTNADRVYVLGYGNAHSRDGGRTWSLGSSGVATTTLCGSTRETRTTCCWGTTMGWR